MEVSRYTTSGFGSMDTYTGINLYSGNDDIRSMLIQYDLIPPGFRFLFTGI